MSGRAIVLYLLCDYDIRRVGYWVVYFLLFGIIEWQLSAIVVTADIVTLLILLSIYRRLRQ